MVSLYVIVRYISGKEIIQYLFYVAKCKYKQTFFFISDEVMPIIGGHEMLTAVIILGCVISVCCVFRFIYVYAYTLTFVYVLTYIICGAKNYFLIMKKDIKTYNRRK